jgi:hypothetical protein
MKKCKKFPCKEFSALDIDAIQSHERVSVFLTGLKLRRTTLHYQIFTMKAPGFIHGDEMVFFGDDIIYVCVV